MKKHKRLFILWILIIGLMVMGSSASSILASETAQTEGRIIQFAGRDWYVKAGVGMGPGPNNWSDDAESVWVDAAGKLHLKIRNIGGDWHSAEVYSVIPAGYGMHRFYVDTPMNNLDVNVVLGLFLYRDGQNEIDVEVARWQQVGTPNGQFVVQPYDQPGHRERFFVIGDGPTMYEFDWQPEVIHFRSLQGHDPNSSELISQWDYAQDYIPPENPAMLVRMNLWLIDSFSGPTDGQEVEVVIANLEAPAAPTTLQVADCDDISLMEVYPALAEAQTALDNGNMAEALDAIARARAALESIEAQCTGIAPATPDPSTSPGLPVITITESGGQVSGTVSPSAFCNSNYKLALYAETDRWYVQPFADSRRNIEINADCTWQTNTRAWEELAVHLVPATYNIPTTSLSSACPPLSASDILASTCYSGNLEAPAPTTSQVADCDDISLMEVYPALAEAQTALDNGNMAEALDAIARARAALESIEAQCTGFTPGQTQAPPPTSPPATPVPLPTSTGLPVITITVSGEQVSGTVSPSAFCNSNYKLALYARTDRWYVQPFADDRRNIEINDDCTWQTNTHPWDRLAVHLVTAAFDIPTQGLGLSCPPLTTSDILASTCYSG